MDLAAKFAAGRARGLAAPEVGNLVAYSVGLRPVPRGWTQRQLTHLLFVAYAWDRDCDAGRDGAVTILYPPEQGTPLTEREQDVLRLAAQGMADKVIAHRLGLAESTVGQHFDLAFRRLGVHSRIEAFRALGWLA